MSVYLKTSNETIWQEQKFTAFLITHDVDEAVMLGDRILLIDKGRITMDTRVTLPRPRKRKDREFVTLADKVLERLMGDEAGLINGEQEAIKQLASA